jgi:hypothetical protein
VTAQAQPLAGEAASDNAAWVTIETPLAVNMLAAFCTDLEQVYRINPYLEFSAWHELAPDTWRAAYRNLSNGADVDVKLTLARSSACEFALSYSCGIKRRTRFSIQPAVAGSTLTIVDDYEVVSHEQAERDADRSLHAWGVALHEYLARHARWQWCAPWRWAMRRVWTPMKPAARRITTIILLVTLAEVALFALVMAIWWAGHRA